MSCLFAHLPAQDCIGLHPAAAPARCFCTSSAGCFLAGSSRAAATISVWALSAVMAGLQPMLLVDFLNELVVLALQVFYEY